MLTCLENLIGIRSDCGEQTASDSGLYLQDLSFINMKVADAIITNQTSGYDLLKEKLQFAGEYLLNDVINRMSPYFKQNSIIENDISGYYQENRNLMPGIPGTLKGIQLKVREYPYMEAFISTVSLFVDYTGSIDLKVYDLIQGKLIDTISVPVIAGEICTVNVFKSYKTNGQYMNLFFGYDAAGENDITINGYQSYVYHSYAGGCLACPGPKSYGNKFVYLYSKSLPASGTPIENSLQSANDTGGLSITYSLNCTLDKFICSIRNRMAMALLHRAGMEILREVKVSTRFNSVVVLHKEEVDNLALFYENEYQKAMDNVFKNLKLPNDICFNCNSMITNSVVRV